MESSVGDRLARPTSSPDRHVLLDACRGFALAGIFLVNLAVFSGFVFMPREAMAALPTAPLDFPAAFLIVWLASGKFYSLFSLLFGIGFSLQLAAADRRGDPSLRLFRRRLLGLVAIGAVHLYFWEGDILVLYALVGLLLIPLRRLSDTALLGGAAALLLAPVALQALIVSTGGALDPGAPLLQAAGAVQVAAGFPADAQPFPLLRDAGWIEYLRFQLSGPFFRYADLLTSGRPFKVLAMFLVGLWVGRRGLLGDLEAWTSVLRRIRTWGFAVGLPASALQAAMFLGGASTVNPWFSVVEAGAYALGVAPLALAYAATIALLWRSQAWRARLTRLAPAGRMALSNYLSQTILAIALFHGVGLGLMGKVGPILWLPMVVVTIALQAAASRWWLTRCEFGPVEWLWRQATYGTRLPLRRTGLPELPSSVADDVTRSGS
jgi:uncharacterized protein